MVVRLVLGLVITAVAFAVAGRRALQLYRLGRTGQPVEVTFKFLPGKIYTGRVESILQAVATGQTQTSGVAVMPKAVQAAPFVARVKLDDAEIAARLPAGRAGEAAIFTDHVKATHIIRKVLLRQIAILNYVNPF